MISTTHFGRRKSDGHLLYPPSSSNRMCQLIKKGVSIDLGFRQKEFEAIA
jgi:hypothetical protein